MWESWGRGEKGSRVERCGMEGMVVACVMV
jgi:hypothetical protein